MNHVKILACAVVAVAAMIVFVGPSAASATVLCKEPGTGSPIGTTCPAGAAYEKGTVIHITLDPGTGPGKLTDGNGNIVIECEETTSEGRTDNEGTATETVKGPVEEITLSKCHGPSGEVCEVITVKPGSLEVHWIEGSNNGTVTSSGTEMTTLCKSLFGNIHCIYVTNNTDLQTLTGGNPATQDIEAAPMPQTPTSSLCPSEAKWDAKYEVTSPKPLYVAGHT